MVNDALMKDVSPQRQTEDVSREREDLLGSDLGGDHGVDGGERDVDGEEGSEGRFGEEGHRRDWVAWEEGREGRREGWGKGDVSMRAMPEG